MSFSLPVFPVLPGQAWPVKKAPKFSTRIQKGISGRELREIDQPSPIWEFTLDFGVLRDKHDIRAGSNIGLGVGYDELRTLMGFFLAQQGSFGPFLFDDPTDNIVAGQYIGTGDGVTSEFPLYRQMGEFFEPISAVIKDGSKAFTLYQNGAEAVGYSYSSLGYSGICDRIGFSAPPPAGTLITADFSYFFLCRFSDDSAEWSNDLYQIWTQQGLKFKSILP